MGGNEPVSFAVQAGLVYVANAGDSGSNYTGFAQPRRPPPPAGRLRRSRLPDGSSPGDVLFHRDGSRLVGVRVNTSPIDTFAAEPDGNLVAAKPGRDVVCAIIAPWTKAT